MTSWEIMPAGVPLDPDEKLDIERLLDGIERYRPRRRGWTWREIVPNQRLRYVQLADFIPEVAPYDVDTVVELAETPAGVRMTITFDAMHDEAWTQRMTMGMEGQLGKLDKRFAKAGL